MCCEAVFIFILVFILIAWMLIFNSCRVIYDYLIIVFTFKNIFWGIWNMFVACKYNRSIINIKDCNSYCIIGILIFSDENCSKECCFWSQLFLLEMEISFQKIDFVSWHAAVTLSTDCFQHMADCPNLCNLFSSLWIIYRSLLILYWLYFSFSITFTLLTATSFPWIPPVWL